MTNQPEKLRESKMHGTMQFPLAVYHMEGEAGIVSHHWHDEIELIYMERGAYLLEINMRRMPQKEGAFFFVNKEELHYLKTQFGCREQAIVFDLRLLASPDYDCVQQQFITPLMNGRLRFPMMIERESSAGHLLWEEFIRVMEQQEKKSSSSYLRMKSSLWNMLVVLEDHHLFEKTVGDEEANQSKIAAVKAVMTYIRQHYREKIYIRDMADLVSLNEQYLCRYFKKAIGKTLVQYIVEYRIDCAAEQLSEEQERIVDICYNSGFDNMGYFIKKFKQIKGCTPSVYRNKIKSQNSVNL